MISSMGVHCSRGAWAGRDVQGGINKAHRVYVLLETTGRQYMCIFLCRYSNRLYVPCLVRVHKRGVGGCACDPVAAAEAGRSAHAWATEVWPPGRRHAWHSKLSPPTPVHALAPLARVVELTGHSRQALPPPRENLPRAQMVQAVPFRPYPGTHTVELSLVATGCAFSVRLDTMLKVFKTAVWKAQTACAADTI